MNQLHHMRLIVDRPLDSPTNMARDEALLERVGMGSSPPTLRLYQWDPPTISLGYFQRYADYESLDPPARHLSVVRRQTGGGAILHDLELTYSITLSLDHPLLDGGPNKLYERAHDVISRCLSKLGISAGRCGVSDESGAAKGPFFCFARRHCYDLLISGHKIAGSAQRRTRHALLQHGSIVLANRFPQQPSAWLDPASESRGSSGDSKSVDSLPPIPDGFKARLSDLVERLPQQFQRTLCVTLDNGTWTNDERALATELYDKYAGDEWTKRT